jgi:hypothetical protein
MPLPVIVFGVALVALFLVEQARTKAAAAAAASAAAAAPAAAAASNLNQLLGAMTDPNWQTQVQKWLLTETSPDSLVIFAGYILPAEPTGAQALSTKIAALQGRTVTTPPPVPVAVDNPAAQNVFSNAPASWTSFGSGTGPYGLDPTVAQLDSDGQTYLLRLLQQTPIMYATAFPKSGAVQANPSASLSTAIRAAEPFLRQNYPITATALRFKAAYIDQSGPSLTSGVLAGAMRPDLSNPRRMLDDMVAGAIAQAGSQLGIPTYGPPRVS